MVTKTNFANSSSEYIKELKDTEGIFRTRKLKDRQHNNEKKKDKRTTMTN